jgi:hypothetical protein
VALYGRSMGGSAAIIVPRPCVAPVQPAHAP